MSKVKIGDVCNILNGFAFKSERYVDEGIRVIRITNVQKGYIEDEKPQFYPVAETENIKDYILQENDLLLSLTGNVGRVAMLDKSFLPAALNQRVACLRIKDSGIVLKYLYYALLSNKFENECISSAKGIAQKNMSTEWLKGYEITICSNKKQIEIVAVLDNLMKIISARKRQLQQLDELVKARFVEMFGDPVINDKGWLIDKLGNYMTTLTDFSANGSYELLDSNVVMYDEPNYAIMVRTTDLESGNLTSGVKYIDESAYNLLDKSKLFGGELIMNKIGSAGKIYVMPHINHPASLGRNAFMFRFDSRLDMTYLYALLTSDYGVNEIQQYVRGAVTKTITKDSTRSIRIIVPPIELQNEFADFVKQIDKSKVVVQKALDEAQTLFDSLMQEYFG